MPRDMFEIDAGDADKPRLGRIVDRVDAAVLINPGLAGIEPIFLHRFEIGVAGRAAVLAALPFGHVRVFRRLPVDRPRLAVIVRRRYARAVVAVREHLEAELRVFVEDFDPARRVVAATCAHEILVAEQTFEPFAHLLAPGRARVALERRAAVGDELVEIVRHLGLPGAISWLAEVSRRFPLGARAEAWRCIDKGPCGASYGPDRRSLSSERANRECGAGLDPKSAAAPATVSGEPVPQATGSNPGRR